MESERRVVQATTLVLAVVTAVFAAGTFTGLAPGATMATALGLAAIVAVVSIAAADRLPAAAASTATTTAPGLVQLLALELERGRRHEQPFSVIRLPRVGDDPEADATIREHLRAIDEVVVDGDSIYLLLPGADRVAAEGCIERLAATAPGSVPREPARRASFPDDGITLGGLLAVLDGAPAGAGPDDLPSLERRRRIVVDLTATTAPTSLDPDATLPEEVDA